MTELGAGLDGSSRHDIAHTKRFLERLGGDQDFRHAAWQSPSALDGLLEGAGIDLPASALQPFCRLVGPECRTQDARKAILDEIRTYPLGQLWDAWTNKPGEQMSGRCGPGGPDCPPPAVLAPSSDPAGEERVPE